MNKYFAFLRGINISGKNKIPMAELKTAFEKEGFSEVSTYLNSGNVAFSTDCDSIPEIRTKIEKMIENVFQLAIPVYVICKSDLKRIMENAPEWWGNDKEKYHNLIFILSENNGDRPFESNEDKSSGDRPLEFNGDKSCGDRPREICKLIGEPSPDLEQIQIFENVIFWSFDLKKYQKCNWWKKTAAAGIGEKLTIRTAGTIGKLLK